MFTSIHRLHVEYHDQKAGPDGRRRFTLHWYYMGHAVKALFHAVPSKAVLKAKEGRPTWARNASAPVRSAQVTP